MLVGQFLHTKITLSQSLLPFFECQAKVFLSSEKVLEKISEGQP